MKNKIIFFIASVLMFAGLNVFAVCETNTSYTYNEFGTYCPSGCPSGTVACDENSSYVCRTKCYCEIGTYYSVFSDPCNCPSGTQKCYPESLGDQKYYCSSSCPTSIETEEDDTPVYTNEDDDEDDDPFVFSTEQTITAEGGGLVNPVPMNNFSELIDKIAEWMLNIGLVLAPLMFVIGGIMFMTANGNPSKILTAQHVLIYTAIGILTILLAKSLVDILSGFIK
ncbi:MAG: pilin [Candidatus Pacebacteria bacterium]|nr:pilin [Candidatus Paceibacterota bacterium]